MELKVRLQGFPYKTPFPELIKEIQQVILSAEDLKADSGEVLFSFPARACHQGCHELMTVVTFGQQDAVDQVVAQELAINLEKVIRKFYERHTRLFQRELNVCVLVEGNMHFEDVLASS